MTEAIFKKLLITTKNQLIAKELSHEKYAEIELNAFTQNESINFIDEKLNKVHKNKLHFTILLPELDV